MILSLHNLARTYKILPHEAMERSDTFDLYVLDVASRWVKYQNDLADGKESLTKKSSKQPTTEEMLKMIEKVKKRGANGNKD